MEEIIIIGAGGHGKVIADIVEKMGLYRIYGFLDGTPEKKGKVHFGYKIMAEDEIAAIPVRRGLIGVADNASRARMVARALSRAPSFEFVTAIHPSAQVARDVEIGPGTVVMAGATINSGARIGRHCIINTQGSLDHDSVMEDFSSLAPGVHCGGNVHLGMGSAVSIGAAILHGIRIGVHSVIGAGAVVTRNMPDHVLAYGVPCRVIRVREEGERYL